MLGGGQQRVEEQLAVLAPRVTLAGQRPAAEDVVAVHGVATREDAVVQADEADHAVRHRAHRHHRAHRQRAGAEVGPRRSAGQPRLRASRGRRRAAARAHRPSTRPRPGPARARAAAAARHRRRRPPRGRGPRRAARPSTRRPWSPTRARSGSLSSRSRSSASRPARSISLLPTSSSGSPRPRWRWSSPLIATPSSTLSSPERQVLLEKRSIENRRRDVASSPHRTFGAGHPATQPVEVVVGEPEPAAARLAAREVEDVGGGDPAAAELEQRRQPGAAAGWCW